MNEIVHDVELMEKSVTNLLLKYAANEFVKTEIVPMVAKKSLMMGHLYKDLGLPNRFVMGRFMKQNFPQLAAQKPKDKLWKKFIYDELNLIAPACYACKDQINCFACKLEDECA